MRTRFSESPFRNPILIGAITILITVVAVYLAYNANSGLPFVPTYNLNVEVPDAAGLIASDSVLVGGTRVGYVSGISGSTGADGSQIAVLHVRLAKSIEPLPADTTDLVRPVSPLGLKYLELERGHSSQTLAAGATIPASHTSLPVEVDDLLQMFDAPTRRASASNLDVFGDAFASRGQDLNRALSRLHPLVDHLEPVMSSLLKPTTRWSQLFPGIEQAANEVVGVAGDQADLFSALDRTFTPLSQQTPALQAAIAGGPSALQTATRELPAQARFIDDSTNLLHRFRPAFAKLGTTSEQVAPTIAVGIPALRRAPALNDRLDATLSALERLADDSRTLPGLALLTETARLLAPTIAFATPAQTTCNYLTLFFRNLESALSESDDVGSFLRIGILALPQLPNSEAGPSSAPADGPPVAPGTPQVEASLEDDSFLHSNPYPNTDAPGQTAECEAGNETYIRGRQVIGNDPGNQGLKTEQTKRTLP
jgi:phospholipid/cholesterol/gamma-HCH transport system substrate-binding protein